VDVLIDITGLGLDGITQERGAVTIGATTKISSLLGPEIESRIPVLQRAVSLLASPLIRNMATVGGSLSGVFLPSDLGITLLALGADLHLQGEGERTVSIEDLLDEGWLSGYDILTRVSVSKPGNGAGAGFAKFGRSAMDIALVCAAALVETSGRNVRGVRIAVGQTSSKPLLLSDLTRQFQGSQLTIGLIESLSEQAAESVKPRSDARASGEYRKHLVRVMVARALLAAAEEAGIRVED
jgi:CO/xanthine dehydrogenase FAD-binding subunit